LKQIIGYIFYALVICWKILNTRFYIGHRICFVADGAMSLGCSVLVHCAAGISRSPALAVAYVMYSLEMDLDHAYR